MKTSACVYARKPDGSILLTTRRKSSPSERTSYGLPGGKVDPGETMLQTAVRETKEETGIDLDPSKLVKVFETVCKGEVDYQTACFYVDVPQDLEIPGGIEEGIDALWGSVAMLLEESPFVAYNQEMVTLIADRLKNQYTFTSGNKVFECHADNLTDAQALATSYGFPKVGTSSVSIGGRLVIRKSGQGATVLMPNTNASKFGRVFTTPGGELLQQSLFAGSIREALVKHADIIKQYKYNPQYLIFWKHNGFQTWVK